MLDNTQCLFFLSFKLKKTKQKQKKVSFLDTIKIRIHLGGGRAEGRVQTGQWETPQTAGKILPSHKNTDYKSFYCSFMDLYVCLVLFLCVCILSNVGD